MKHSEINTTRIYFMLHIHREDQAIEFLNRLYKDGLMYHPEDDAFDIVDENDEKFFTHEEAWLLNERMDEVFKVMDDPCDHVLKLITLNENKNE